MNDNQVSISSLLDIHYELESYEPAQNGGMIDPSFDEQFEFSWQLIPNESITSASEFEELAIQMQEILESTQDLDSKIHYIILKDFKNNC